MKIAFDAQPLFGENKSGIGYYAHYLVDTLLKSHPEHEYQLQYFGVRNEEEKKEQLKYYVDRGAETRQAFFKWKFYRLLSAFFPLLYKWFFGKENDVTHFFNYFVPPGVHGKKVVTIHDMCFKEYPETVRFKTKLLLQLTMKRSIRRADVIVTDSEFSKKEILRYYHVDKDKIQVVPCGVDRERFQPISSSEERKTLDNLRGKYGLKDRDYFLYVGTIEPRKNLINLLKAYRLFLNESGAELASLPVLVMAGGSGWLNSEIYQTVQEEGLQDQVAFTGYLKDEEVPILMAGAYAFVFPSLYEGFGMPVLEAMACGVPVLTSNNSSLIEVAEKAAVMVDPYEVNEIVKGIKLLYEDDELRNKNIKLGFIQVQKYSWEQSAKKLFEIYQK